MQEHTRGIGRCWPRYAVLRKTTGQKNFWKLSSMGIDTQFGSWINFLSRCWVLCSIPVESSPTRHRSRAHKESPRWADGVVRACAPVLPKPTF
jgi:hypothetical protein